MQYLNIRKLAALAVLASLVGVAQADASRPGGSEISEGSEWNFKLTPSYYRTTNETDAYDLNLRANTGAHAMWLAHYQRGSEFDQSRTGYEYTAQLPFGQLVPSLQVATGGFAGGSINAQIGDQVYGLVGYGRTNAHDYYNLNFDPNDSIVYGLGTRLLPQSNLSLFTVKDIRFHTGQTVTHLVWRLTPDARQRWTVDLSNKHGRATADDDPVSGNSLSVTYDYRDFFVRLAKDNKVNFTAEDQSRFTLGFRF